MVFIYDMESKQVISFYDSNISQINTINKNQSELIGMYCEFICDNDFKVIENPLDYRLVFVDDVCIGYSLKPNVKLTLSKKQIENDGIDSTILTVEIFNTHPLDEFKNIEISIDNIVYDIDIINNIGNAEIVAINEGLINIECLNRNFISSPIILEVI